MEWGKAHSLRWLLLLIARGDKSTQAKDIAKALELNRNFVE